MLWDPNRCQFHDPALFDLRPFLSKIPLGIKGPVEATDDPVRQTLDINLDLRIDFRTPRWKASPVLGEAVDGFLAEVPNEVYGLLEGHPMVTHHDHDHVVRIAFGLFTIVGEDILEGVRSENRRKVNDYN